jgi:hypothetical protein
MIEIDLDTSGLETAILEFANVSRKALGEVVKQQAGILVGHVIALTPPGGRGGQALTDRGGIALEAKKRGESSIAADIAKLFPTSKLPTEALLSMTAAGMEFKTGKGHKDIVRDVAESIGELRILHQRARNPQTGRTRKGKGAAMAVTRKNILQQYIRQEIAKVGKLNAGWINAATELKTAGRAVPNWIKRHGAKDGGADIQNTGPMVGVRIFNNQTWFPQNMTSRVGLAVVRRENGLRKAMEAILARQARAAEQRMARQTQRTIRSAVRTIGSLI